jgi:hypothetical protein
MKKEEFNFDYIVNQIIDLKQFSYGRWGDGEMACVFGRKGCNVDKHEYFQDMRVELRNILESQPPYFLGLQRLGAEQNKDNPEFIRLRDMNTWVDNEVFSYASRDGRMGELRDALLDRNVIQVANGSLKPLWLADIFIEIPLVNCWLSKDEILSAIRKHIQPNDVILYSASMPTKYFINEIYKEFGDTITQLDCGSVWDVYVGRETRSYMKNIQKKTL